jgi:hypothetical protein
MKENGLRIMFRSTELGSIKRDMNNDATFHPHAHLIVDVKRRIKKEKWSSLLAQVRAYLGSHFNDSSSIAKAKEACKYCVKPADLQKLTSLELKELHEAVFRLHNPNFSGLTALGPSSTFAVIKRLALMRGYYGQS